ncbi:unnamed protein product [Rotaria sordida]|uniref:Beta-galactosidase n=1 Tax=Rotaria sordida TaxID=392033 RepID=A0A814VWZ4_9BILA|nr:unnamed protein product [Rotaria sordida]CAF3932731.1 unnamed protein product [Rotaria sordida]
MPVTYSPTLVLDNERHLFIRLFKDNDRNRKYLQPFRILSGSLHYFRVLPQLWSDRIKKMKAAGLNTIETYVPWNIHEPQQGNYQFGKGFTDLAGFLKLIHENEMFAIVRPSGYICAEWEWGGLPSWLLRDETMRVRSNHQGFLRALRNYYSRLLPILAEHQYNRHGTGSIIAFQIENEYGSYGNDTTYLEAIRSMYIEYGLDEILLTSDGPKKLAAGTLDDVWATVNFQREPREKLEYLRYFRPKHHMMITEYWTGWFDYWGGKHQTGSRTPYDAKMFEVDLEEILLTSKEEISINFYMFSGGTNFGFTSGAVHFPSEQYKPLVTSYDYDAPLNEAGDPTPKYYAIRRVLEKFYSKHPDLYVLNNDHSHHNKYSLPTIPPSPKKISYGTIQISGYKTFDDILADDLLTITSELTNGPKSMEKLSVNNKSGASQGFILYTAKNIVSLTKSLACKVTVTAVADNAVVLVNGQVIFQSLPNISQFQFDLSDKAKNLTILVENMGRVNFGPLLDHGRKGLLGKVLLNDKIEIKEWIVHVLEFRKGTSNMNNWRSMSIEYRANNFLLNGPRLFFASFFIDNQQSVDDTYLKLDSKWSKGVAFCNGFNLGRYWNVGPQRTLYIPAQLLFKGLNQIQLFELYTYGHNLSLVDTPVINER